MLFACSLRRLTLAVLLGLAGCAQGLDSEAAKRTVANSDEFKPYSEVRGAMIRTGPVNDHRLLQLLARRDRKTGAVTTHAEVGIIYHQRATRHYEITRNARAEVLPMRMLLHEGTGCRRLEGCVHTLSLLIDIPEADLRASVTSGYQFKVFARAGEEALFQVPPSLIEALLKAIDAPPAATASTR